jgi:histidyl-tRNA synthetase
VENVFRNIGYKLGFDEIEPSIIQPSEALPRDLFSGWDERLFFKLPLVDYTSEKNLKLSEGILRPEGTLPVCRYLSEIISNGENPLPAKLMYILSCFRNESSDSLTETKLRNFNQLGVEVFGSSNNDDEIIRYANETLAKLNVKDVRFRLNDVQIFNQLTSYISEEEKQTLQCLLDSYSGRKASGVEEKLEIPFFDKDSLFFRPYMDSEKAGEVSESLGLLLKNLETSGINAVFDPTVVRGFSYYTGPVFQIDVNKNSQWISEIAGGGRYDNVLGSYLKCFGIEKKIPATGFAFGTERLLEVSK